MQMSDKSAVIQRVCEALFSGDHATARHVAHTEYPFALQKPAPRTYTAFQSTLVFLRDGFIDRYSGQRLIFPGLLGLLSKLLPEEFPFHPNWKISECHIVYWELFPTIDHIVPVTRGGTNDEANWATTSMLRNAMKSNWTLEQLSWSLMPAGSLAEWDGLIRLYVIFVESDRMLLRDAYLSRWYQAARRALNAA